MKKVTSIISLLLFALNFLFGQNNDYYWYKNQKIYLNEISNKRYVIVKDELNNSLELKQMLGINDITIIDFEQNNVLATINPYESSKTTENYWAVIESSDIADIAITEHEYILYEAPFYHTTEGIEVGLSHLFYVKLYDEQDIAKLEQLAEENNIEILGNNYYMPLWFTLSCSQQSNGNALEMANLIPHYIHAFFISTICHNI